MMEYFWKRFFYMVSFAWQAALGVVRIPNSFGKFAFCVFVLIVSCTIWRRSFCAVAVLQVDSFRTCFLNSNYDGGSFRERESNGFIPMWVLQLFLAIS